MSGAELYHNGDFMQEIFVFFIRYATINGYMDTASKHQAVPVPENGRALEGGIDSSTAIILYKSGLLERFCAGCNIITTDTVQTEIARGPDGHDTARILSKFCRIEHVSTEGPFGKGENSILNLFKQGKASAVFSDDGRFLEYCSKENIPHYSSIMAPYLLYTAKKLKKKEGLDHTRSIAAQGRFSEWVLEKVNRMWEGGNF